MRPYIVNLTNYLIGKNSYYQVFYRLRGEKKDFISHVHIDLAEGDLTTMSPETLGKIMGALEDCDVLATHDELFREVTFAGSCDQMHRSFVAVCLAHVIWSRFNHELEPGWAPRERNRMLPSLPPKEVKWSPVHRP